MTAEPYGSLRSLLGEMDRGKRATPTVDAPARAIDSAMEPAVEFCASRALVISGGFPKQKGSDFHLTIQFLFEYLAGETGL